MTLRAVSQPSLAVDYTLHRDNDSLLNGQKPSYYPFKIPSHHQQLRHYISTVDADILYFVSNNELHAVHLPTHQRERIASVPFVPTCLGAGYGWLCVGGYNKGQCAFIDLRDAPPFAHFATSTHPTEVDELLPLDLDPNSRLLTTQEQPHHERRPLRRRAKVVTKEIGQLIVNAITVHRFEHKSKDVRDETVAVLSNNDKTVTLYSLTQHTTLKTLPFPILMNHATISPDGQMMLAVGDEGRAFFLRRTAAASQQKSSYRVYDWQELASVRLNGTVATDCCFSTAFSPSGHVCAVASQFGTITLYDAGRIHEDMEDDEAVIDILQGSRQSFTGSSFVPGAPRSMAFSPEPWDLLVWAEDHGRICITDMRDGFRSRQTVNVNLDDELVDRIELSDIDAPPSAEQLELEREALFVRRHQEALDAQDPLAAVQSAADYMESAAERRRRRMQLLNSGISLNDEPSLSDAEREILETLRIHRLRENAGEPNSLDSSGRPFSINYSNHTPGSNSPSSANLPISFGQYVSNRGTNRNPPSLFGYPRRRGSIVISNSNAANSSSQAHPSSLTPGGPAPLSASPARLTPTSTSESQQPPSARDTPPSPLAMPPSLNDPWQTISAAMASTSANQNSTSSSSRNMLSDISLAHLAERRQDDPLRLSALYAHSLLRRPGDSRRSGADSNSAETGRETPEELVRHRFRERERERERDRETALRRERLRAMHAASNEAEAEIEALSRIERLQRLRSARFRQLRERAGLSGDSFGMSMGDEDLAFLQELSMLVDQGVTDRDPPSRMNGEVGIQGVGWTRDGRHLYIGTEEGILKYDVNIRNRMTFPGISLR